jgi:XTP/dITP diphosphohydrolase
MKICFATQNRNKLKEIQEIFANILGNSIELVCLADLDYTNELAEDGNTFEANSLQKARFVYDTFNINCFADDSGLEVEALNGEPGVNSAFYAGEDKNYAANNALLLKNLTNITNRNAQFRTCITLVMGNETQQFNGIVKGKILTELRGTNGFGYDPLFMPNGYDRTFAEMASQEKNLISHRALAVQKLVEFLKSR